jgi:multimeric flavodoxin WrbA
MFQRCLFVETTAQQTIRILAITGSGRKHGNTARLVEMIGEELDARGKARRLPVVFETICLADMNIESCQGCRDCFERGEET